MIIWRNIRIYNIFMKLKWKWIFVIEIFYFKLYIKYFYFILNVYIVIDLISICLNWLFVNVLCMFNVRKDLI